MMLAIILCLISIILNVSGHLLIPFDFNENSQKLAGILKKFELYHIFFHYEDLTYNDLDILLKVQPKFKQSMFLLNYDRQNPYIRRPKGEQYVHIVFLDDLRKFSSFSDLHYNLRHEDIIFVIVKNMNQVQNIFKDNRMGYYFKNAGVAFFCDFHNLKGYYAHFYKGDLSGKFHTVEDFELQENFSKFINKYSDFNKHILEIGCTPFRPYVNFQPECQIDCEIGGFEGRILKILRSHLNFRIKMRNFKGVSSPWNAMITCVANNEIDFAIGAISHTSPRARMVDFTYFLKQDGYALLFSTTSDNFLKWKDIFRPFDSTVWMCFLFVMVFYPLILKKVATIEFSGIEKPLNYPDYLLLIFKTVVEQSMYSSVSIAKALFTSWVLAVIILTTAYKSKLTSFLISKSSSEPNNVGDLLDLNYYFTVFKMDWSALKENLMELTDPMYKQILKRVKYHRDHCDAIELTFLGQNVFLDENIPLQYQVVHHCQHLSDKYDLNSLRLTRDKLLQIVHAWPIQKGAPYVWRFTKIILNLHETGHIDQWYKLNLHKSISKSNQQINDRTISSLTMSTMIAPVFMLMLGNSFGFLLFVYEVFRHKIKQKNRTKIYI